MPYCPPDNHPYRCTSGRHSWRSAEDAAKCCNGYIYTLVPALIAYAWDRLDRAIASGNRASMCYVMASLEEEDARYRTAIETDERHLFSRRWISEADVDRVRYADSLLPDSLRHHIAPYR